MKKLLAIILAVLMIVSLGACSIAMSPEQKVAKLVENYGQNFIEGLEESFFDSELGLECTSSVRAEGTGMVVDVCINGVDNLSDDAKAQMQQAYDNASNSFDSTLTELQSEEPALEYITINVCEEDGDVIAEITMGNK